MNQRFALILAAGLTAFVLVGIGAVSGQVLSGAAAQGGVQDTPQPTETLSADLQGLIQNREAQYQQLIDEANARLQQAYALQTQAAATQAPTPEPGYPITPDMAAGIAMHAAPGKNILAPADLVDFSGAIAYEVATSGGKIYVDANTGRILYNGTLPPPTVSTSGSSSSGGGGEREHEQEHESGED
jgi:uncharacterized membrane protein YkoI